MTENALFQLVFFILVTLILVKPLGAYMARVYETKPCGLDKALGFLERGFYRLSGVDPQHEMDWKAYLAAMLLFNILGMLAVYALQRLQFYLPFNPQGFSAVAPDLSFNTAASFVANTNWQAYGGETTMSYFTQMFALTVQNFVSAATGMALMVAFIRGLVRHETTNLGNFWVDMVRSTLYILLPLSLILALILASQGVIQNLKPYQTVHLIEKISYQQAASPTSKATTVSLSEQTLPMGPVASQVAIKQLGSNGGGFFNTNSAHPYENPTPISNFFEMLSLILIPASVCYTFGAMVKVKKQGYAILLAMMIVFIPLTIIEIMVEQHTPSPTAALGIVSLSQENIYPGGNLEGKETRFGVTNSAIWAIATTASSNGSVNGMLDSYTPLGGLIPLWLMHLGEVIFGGVGSGLSGMLVLVIITVFIAGLMVGRTPEFLGKKIEPYEMKMASLAVLVMPLTVLIFTAIGAVSKMGTSSLGNPGAHGFTEILYAFSSMTNNNGSAFAGLNANTPFYNILGGIAMLIGRYWIAIPTLAIAGALAKKKLIPSSSGTLPTDTPLFVIMLVGVTLILGALSFLPALALGPIVEQLML